ncbi:MAG: phenylalanine--tRNA ligase subunit beta [Candidatus Omnitrophica bacterium]|nr:phenylalanine--tRNA ligase subunit beta [Candidatus Omnitrophota bacterium]
MKVTYNWLKEFVDIKMPAQELADRLTMSGLEVKSVEEKAGDFVFEIEITSNRPDWLSVIGVAREVAALTGKKTKTGQMKSVKIETGCADKFGIEIEDRNDCPFYTARVIRNVKAGPSPEWLRARLESLGVRSVNNVVDITNYVLFETGEPLHAFDLDKLSGREIVVRRASKGEKLVTIDGQERELSPDILVIADKKKTVAIAGVMGGKDTEVTENTRNVLLEAAIFEPVLIRRGRQKLGMTSDAAYRFERGIDPAGPAAASLRAAKLIGELCAGDLSCAASSGVSRMNVAKVCLTAAGIKRSLGVEIPQARVNNILAGLGFEIKGKKKGCLQVKVPSWRLDVKEEVDLIEEISRIYGFENIPSTLAKVGLKNQETAAQDHISQSKDILFGLGLNEVVTYSLIDRKSLDGFWEGDDSLIAVCNPLSIEQEVMRPVLMPSLVRCVSHNLKQKQEYVNIFEIARVYRLDGKRIQEEYRLGICLCGSKLVWFDKGRVQDEAGFLHLKGAVETLLKRLNVLGQDLRFIAQGAYAFRVFAGDVDIGSLCRLDRKRLDRMEIKNKEVFGAEIDLPKVFSLISPAKKFSALPKFPFAVRDISMILAEALPAEKIIKAILAQGRDLIKEAEVVDRYKGKPIDPGYKGLTISCRYASDDRTLTEAEIAPVHEAVISRLKEEFGARLR